MIFRHAGASGAKTFDGVKVKSIDFDSSNGTTNGTTNGTANGDAHSASQNPGRPISATYTKKADNTSGVIKFDYIVDASGRVGLLNTKYLKNRHYNTTLKNVANWAYFEDAGLYGGGTARSGAPFFEALRDESGWAWFIPLHDGTHSIGVVMNQDIATERKATAASAQEYFDTALKQAPMLSELLGAGKQVSELKAASDYSYHSSSYAFPYARIVGDSGCFIDPFFSSGVHLALTGGLSAGTTIAASIRGHCDEAAAAQWHSKKIREGYARFLLVVLSAYKQMRNQKEAVLSDFNEDNFDRAFSFFKPIIQGTADATNKLTQAEFSKTIDFLTKAFSPAFRNNLDNTGDGPAPDGAEAAKPPPMDDGISPEDREVLQALRTHHGQNTLNLDSFTTDVIDGRVPKLEKGELTLVSVEA